MPFACEFCSKEREAETPRAPSWHHQLSGLGYAQGLCTGYTPSPSLHISLTAQVHSSIRHCFLDDVPVPEGREYPHPILSVQGFGSWCGV